MKFLALALTLSFSIMAFSQSTRPDQYLLVGTYTSEKSEGIYVYRFNEAAGTFTPVGVAKTSNPSYLAVSPNEKYVYAVNENADSTMYTTGGSVAAFSFDKKQGQLTLINTEASGGKHPCYIAVDKTGKWVAAGNYSSGSLAVLKARKDGSLEPAKEIIQHEGHGVNEERQQGPHVHSTVFSKDNNFLFTPDLGLDKVMIYSFNAKSGKVAPAKIPFQMVEAGHGPRHLEFTPNGKFAYLVEEMSGGVSVYAYKKGTLTLLQNISALPAEFTGAIGGADVHASADGKFLYVSNRGASNTIAIFSIDEATGMLKAIGHQSTLGKTPRNFSIDPSGNFLLVANQGSDDIVVFKRDTQTGLLTDTGTRMAVSKPVCLKWISAE